MDVRDTIGRVTDTYYTEENGNTYFWYEGQIRNTEDFKDAVSRVRDGLLSEMSMEASVEQGETAEKTVYSKNQNNRSKQE